MSRLTLRRHGFGRKQNVKSGGPKRKEIHPLERQLSFGSP
jgi:hypothetical protein